MPGSKTYTANKVNELFEIEVHDTIHEIETQHSFRSGFFLEIIKIAISVLLSTIASIHTSDSNIQGINLLIHCIVIFILLYIVLTGLFAIGKYLVGTLLSRRIFRSIRKEQYNLFHKRTLNYVYLGISFENKYSSYLDKNKNCTFVNGPSSDTDLIINYLAQAVYYFSIAHDGFEIVIPKETNNKRKENINAKFVNYIGFPYLAISLSSALNSLDRLDDYISQLKDALRKAAIPPERMDIYLTSISELQDNYIKLLKSSYFGSLSRVNALRNSYDISVKNQIK